MRVEHPSRFDLAGKGLLFVLGGGGEGPGFQLQGLMGLDGFACSKRPTTWKDQLHGYDGYMGSRDGGG